ncbi:uncharacterized protein LOC113121775 isoform X2 [Mastacembelus armatus]|uniref:uncharacterized protein LOC113121775 isoform X2 n=1 Tax=Mastacembelus armatus TaxID=205130 RepID=UPI000E46295A|nr:uncharacterized protein LOC113121775 isoform X2 [Mastacembelus armatus]
MFAEDVDIAQYYEAVPIYGKIKCVNICHRQHSHHKQCYNKGICRVYLSTGPFCECQHVDVTWYLSDDCSLPIKTTAFYIGLSVTFACLLVIVGVLTAFLQRNKQQQKRKRDIREQLVNQWLNEDFEWSRSNTDNHNAGDCSNPAYQEKPEIYRQPVPGYKSTRPSLDTDNTQLSPSPQPHMKINRPQIRTSWTTEKWDES